MSTTIEGDQWNERTAPTLWDIYETRYNRLDTPKKREQSRKEQYAQEKI